MFYSLLRIFKYSFHVSYNGYWENQHKLKGLMLGEEACTISVLEVGVLNCPRFFDTVGSVTGKVSDP